jgi:hypothetical protein
LGGAWLDTEFACVHPFGLEFDGDGGLELLDAVEAGVAVKEAPGEGVCVVCELGFQVEAAGGCGALVEGGELEVEAMWLG